MLEEKIKFNLAKNIFYNPEMQFCRSFCSVALGAIGGKLNLMDAFSASGIRGIRYAKENTNVASIDFLEANDDAIPVLKKNLKLNKIAKAKIIKSLYEKYFTNDFFFYDFIEIDQFGTPVPYLSSTFYGQCKKDEFYLSVTATDVAVLCGPQAKACLKNYHGKNLNNEFTHETGARLLIRRIMESAGEFDFSIHPLFSLSDRHYIKVLLKCDRGAAKADENLEHVGYISFCNRCGWRYAGKRMQNECKNCKAICDFAGPLWLGESHDKTFLERMLRLNAKREYTHKEEIEKTLKLMLNEIGMPPYFYDVHAECRRAKAKSVPKIKDMIIALRKKGFRAERTHFAETGIKTNAEIRELKKYLP